MTLHNQIAATPQPNFSDRWYRKTQSKHTIPSTLAALSGIALVTASAATNAVYGWFKTDLLPYQIIWASVSVAASAILALGPTALLKALRQRMVAGSVIAGLAIALCGSYSFNAAIGASAGQRMNAAAVQSDDTGTRARLETAYQTAKDELGGLPPSMATVAELDAKIAALKLTPGANGCAKIDGPISKKVCPDVATLEVDKVRAARREELQTAMTLASRELKKLGPAKVANTDATAISGYLALAGIIVSTEAINRWFALLAVALVEFGGGLAFALASILREPVTAPTIANEAPSNPPKTKAVDTDDMPKQIAVRPALKLVSNRKTPRKTVSHANFGDRMLALVKERGGELYAGHRPLAKALGCSSAHVANVLRDLTDAGHVTVQATKTGTVVRLAA